MPINRISLFLLISFLFFGCTLNSYEKNYGSNTSSDAKSSNHTDIKQQENNQNPSIQPCSNQKECMDYCDKNPSNQMCKDAYAKYQLPKESNSLNNQDPSNTLNSEWSSGKCEGNNLVKLTSSPMDLDKLGYIEPMGKMVDGHVTPSDHQYWHPKNINSDYTVNEPYDIYSPADGNIVRIEHMTNYVGDKTYTKKVDDYRVIFEHSCRIYTYYIHINELSDKILKESNIADKPYVQTRIPVKSGEKIGIKNTPSFDFAVIDTNITLQGFANPEHYEFEAWKIHTVDPFDYFVEPLKSELTAKSIRSSDPKGGKIDYDINGKLVGSWFKEGTNGYAGIDKERYWSGHLSIVYDYIDPTQVRISIGTFNGKAQQFGVKGNSPDPSSISKSSGLIKYELTSFEYYVDGSRWGRLSFAKDIKSTSGPETKGTLLVQLLENGELKAEAFPDKTASQVNGFTIDAQIYER